MGESARRDNAHPSPSSFVKVSGFTRSDDEAEESAQYVKTWAK